MTSWGDVDAADAAMGRRRHGDALDDADLDEDYGSVAVPVWFHRITVVVIAAVLAALLIGSAYASRVTPDEDLPGSRPGLGAGPVDTDE
jgi:hypothetical protein